MPAPLLTIAVPTYERPDQLRQLLACLDRELEFAGDVTVLISDNASPGESWALLQEAAATRPWLQLHRQPENLGPVANLQWLVAHADEAQYLWCMGDDDVILPGRLSTITLTLETLEPAWLFLPHEFVDDEGEVVGRSPVPPTQEVLPDAGALYRAYHHWLTFLSASIVRRDRFQAAVAEIETDNAYIPLLWFFHAGLEGPAVVAGEPVISGSNSISWADRAHDILTRDFVALYDDGLHRGLTAAEFGATLDELYAPDWALRHWGRRPFDDVARVVARFPQSRVMRGVLWSIARDQGRRDALAVLEGATAAMGDDAAAAALLADGEARFGAGDADGAVERFADATRRAPALVGAWNDLATALHALGRQDEAADAARAALFVAPEDPDARHNAAAIGVEPDAAG